MEEWFKVQMRASTRALHEGAQFDDELVVEDGDDWQGYTDDEVSDGDDPAPAGGETPDLATTAATVETQTPAPIQIARLDIIEDVKKFVADSAGPRQACCPEASKDHSRILRRGKQQHGKRHVNLEPNCRLKHRNPRRT